MYSRVKLTSILIVLACVVSAKKKLKFKHGPTGMSFDDSTNCTEFSKFGRFNPYSVLHEKWFVFYYWAASRPLTTYVFTAPSANHTRRLRKLLDGNCILPVMWHVRQVLMEDNDGYISLLVERSDRGEYWLYPVARVKPGQKITPRDIRLKQTGDNRILGLMDCAEESLLVMSRINDVPRQGDLHAEASRLGYRGRRGRSYLYQGHEWGPVGEADENMFWDRRERKDAKVMPKENKSSQESSEEVEYLPMNEPEEKKKKTKKPKAILPPVVEDQEKCVKVVPELWNDPKPSPNPDNLQLTKEELNNDTNNTLTIDVPNDLLNKQENNLNMESKKVPANDKLDNHQELELKPEMSQNEPQDLGQTEILIGDSSPIENQDPDKQDCVVCYTSKLSYPPPPPPTMPSYIPEKTDSITNLNNNEEETTTETPIAEMPHDEVARIESSHAETASEEISRSKVLSTAFPTAVVHGTEVPISDERHEKTLHPAEVPHVEVTSTKASNSEITRDEISRPEVTPAKLLARPTKSNEKSRPRPAATEQDLTNSSQIIILTPKTLD